MRKKKSVRERVEDILAILFGGGGGTPRMTTKMRITRKSTQRGSRESGE